MNEFNFYINVDECLNMSNFEMFFYKLQNEDKFYVAEASFGDPAGSDQHASGVRTIQSALYGIKNYIGQSSVLIRDYRLIFGIRQLYNKKVPWKETVLYRLLKIHYCLQNARLFIKTRDTADKNVTVILLYDVENTMDEREIPEEIVDNTPDIPALMEYLGVKWEVPERLIPEKEIVEAMMTVARQQGDETTLQFVEDYHNWYMENRMYEGEENDVEGALSLPGTVPARSREEAGQARRFNNIYNLISFIDSTVGSYCVFTKTIGSNMGEHRLALLGIVDYITTGLAGDPKESGDNVSNETLKTLARNNRLNARNDRMIWKKYGSMMQAYEARMQLRQREMAGKMPTSGEKLIYGINSPKRLSCEYNGLEFEKRITHVLDEFEIGAGSFRGERHGMLQRVN